MSGFKFIIFTIRSEIIATIIRQEKTCKNYKIKNMWIMVCQKNTPSVLIGKHLETEEGVHVNTLSKKIP